MSPLLVRKLCHPCLLLMVFLAGFATHSAAATLTLRYPESGQVINIGTLVVADLDATFPRDQISQMNFEYSTDGSSWTPINGVAPFGLAEFATLWHTRGLASGAYFLRARLVPVLGSEMLSAAVTVQLNAVPATVAVISGTATPFRLRFDATATTDPDGDALTQLIWNFGDGTTGIGSVVEHSYARAGVYGVSVTAQDALGGEASGHYIATLLRSGLLKGGEAKEKKDCGCKKMTIKHAGAVEGPAGFNFQSELATGIPPAEQGKLGPYNDGTADGQLDLTKPFFSVKSRFEVIAELVDFSKPQLCEEGQRVQGTVSAADGTGAKPHKSNFSSDPRYDTTKDTDDPFDAGDDETSTEVGDCGLGGAKFCDDDYHGGGNSRGRGDDGKQPPNLLKRYEDQKRILWLDPPGLHFMPKARIVDDGERQVGKFEAKVKGSTGECKCSWEIEIEINKTGKVTKNRLFNVNCTP